MHVNHQAGQDSNIHRTHAGGELMSFLMATQSIQKSMGAISTLFGSIVRGSVAGARVFEYVLEKPTITIEGGLVLDDARGEVCDRYIAR